MRPMRILTAVTLGLALAGAAGAAAQDYPTRPVTIVVPYTPGGSTEIMSRLVGQKLEEKLGKPVLIEMKPGAGTVIGASAVAKSVPDGHTLLMATPTPMAINVAIYKNLPYDPRTDLVPLAMLAQAPFILLVNPSLPVTSVQDLIGFAKANPGQLSYGSGGLGAPHHLYAELLKSMTGIR
jgi:tripartite-type tricarboxylate transporter receptor subunit TctC